MIRFVRRRDPSEAVGFSDVLYNNEKFVEAVSAALGEDGVFVSQFGEASKLCNPGANFSSTKFALNFIQHLVNHGFVAVKEFMEAHGGFLGNWGFLISFKAEETKANWYANQAEVELKLKERAVRTLDGSDSPFRYFDGATMMGYQYSSRVEQEVFCRTTPAPDLCDQGHGLDPAVKNVPASSLEVRQSTIPNGGRGVFFKESVSKGTYIASEQMVHAILFLPMTTWWIKHLLRHTENAFFKVLDVYMFGYGYAHDFFGMTGYSVEPSVLQFVNHGCDGSYNTGIKLSVTEKTADPKQMPDDLYDSVSENSQYSPIADRNSLLHMHAFETALRDIDAGEEFLDNYLGYLTVDNWEAALADYRAQCTNQDVGAINRYEGRSKDEL
jgi:hypothetical protein